MSPSSAALLASSFIRAVYVATSSSFTFHLKERGFQNVEAIKRQHLHILKEKVGTSLSIGVFLLKLFSFSRINILDKCVMAQPPRKRDVVKH